MPELPDLQIYANNLRRLYLDKKIIDIEIFSQNCFDVDKQLFIDTCKTANFKNITQDGKEIKFLLDNDNIFSVHLMLFGKFTHIENTTSNFIRNKIVDFIFEDNTGLTISDEQMFTKIQLNPSKKPSPDVLSDDFTYPYFLSIILRSPRKNIKALLLDQKSVRGLGNAYVDEILYSANISPKSKTGKIPEGEIEKLYNEIKKTLLWGIDNIKKLSPDIISGEVRDFFKVHNKNLKFTEKGERIIIEKIASKKTYYTFSQIVYE